MVKSTRGFLILETALTILLLAVVSNLLIRFLESRTTAIKDMSFQQRRLQSFHNQSIQGRGQNRYIFDRRSQRLHEWAYDFGGDN